MKKEARVVIVEDDPFAQNWLALMLARDWRARVIGELDSLSAMADLLKTTSEKPNLILINADLLDPAKLAALGTLPGAPLVVLTGKTPNTDLLRQLPFPHFGGYLLKKEIRFALGWAVAYADSSEWVITPGLEPWFRAIKRPAGPESKIWVMDGRRSIHNLTEHEIEVARMALIFSMERRELSDEMRISSDWSYGLVSTIYHKLGMEEILSGEIDAVEFLGKQFAETPRFQETIKQAAKPKRNDLESLAFHILTLPEIRELN